MAGEYPELTFDENEDFTADRLNSAMKTLDARLRAQESMKVSFEDAVDTLNRFGLQRLQEAVQPVYDRLSEISHLGAIFTADSKSTVSVGVGTRTFIISSDNRDAFAAAAYIGVQSTEDPETLLFGPLQSYDRLTGTLVIGVSQFEGTQGANFSSWRISAAAAPNFNATAHSVGAYTQAEVDGTFLAYGKDQIIDATARARAKKNLRVDQPTFIFSSNQTLNANHIGAAIGCDPGCTALTLPRMSAVESGAKILIHAYTQNVTVSVDASETLGIYAGGNPGVRSVVVPARWSLEIVNRGDIWLPRLVPWGSDTPNANTSLSFTATQKKTLKQQIGSGGLISGYSASASLLASVVNSTVFLTSDAYTLVLPVGTSLVNGDYIEFANIQSGTITIAKNGADNSAIYYGINSATANITIGPGQTLKLTFDSVNWIASGRGVTPERVPSLDVAQSFTAAQRARLRTNILLDGVGIVGISANTSLIATGAGTSYVLNGSSSLTVDLPLVSTTAMGDSFRLVNQSTQNAILRVNQATDLAGSPVIVAGAGVANSKSLIIPSGATAEIRSTGANWYVEGIKPSYGTIQQGGGTAQLSNKVFVGWSASGLKAQVDATDLGKIWLDYNAASSIGTSGYQKLPSGLIVQWKVVDLSGSPDPVVLWPVSFPNAVLGAIATHSANVSDAGLLTSIRTSNVNANGMQIFTRQVSSGGTVSAYGAGSAHVLAWGN